MDMTDMSNANHMGNPMMSGGGGMSVGFDRMNRGGGEFRGRRAMRGARRMRGDYRHDTGGGYRGGRGSFRSRGRHMMSGGHGLDARGYSQPMMPNYPQDYTG